MKIDFFVHPGWEFRYHKKNSGERYGEYLENLSDILARSELPVLIGEEDFFRDKFPQGNILGDASYWICEMPVDKGEIGPKSWDNFIKLISGKENSQIRIHGAYFGECTEGFAVQLFAHLYRGEHWNNWQCWLPEIEAQQNLEINLRKKHESDGDFKKTNIRYGHVLHSKTKVKIIHPNKYFPLGKRRNGNIDFQLLDENSEIYRV